MNEKLNILYEKVMSEDILDKKYKDDYVKMFNIISKKILNTLQYKILFDKSKTKIKFISSKYGLFIKINNIDWNKEYNAYISNEELKNKVYKKDNIVFILEELSNLIRG